jgi:hypothetical protein
MGLPASAATGNSARGLGGASVSIARLTCSLPASKDVTAVTNFLFGYSIILDASTRVSWGLPARANESPVRTEKCTGAGGTPHVPGMRGEASAYRDLTSRPKSFSLRFDPDQI